VRQRAHRLDCLRAWRQENSRPPRDSSGQRWLPRPPSLDAQPADEPADADRGQEDRPDGRQP
jgi:hypothetical protein